MPQTRPKKVPESKLRRSMGLKVKLALLEMKQVAAYVTADLDEVTRAETIATLRGAANKLNSVADWMSTTGRGAAKRTKRAEDEGEDGGEGAVS